ncbi:hypothetical protein BKA61DRAFT_178971 [Leptodontidium sp. MPI-SDFR-AT-0119]|nr:hypothetical protein BKA61DRAFT_178971 [Leptodontidium sp. MPI-SDFR-AT-0119]
MASLKDQIRLSFVLRVSLSLLTPAPRAQVEAMLCSVSRGLQHNSIDSLWYIFSRLTEAYHGLRLQDLGLGAYWKLKLNLLGCQLTSSLSTCPARRAN